MILGSDSVLDSVVKELSPNWVIVPSSCEDGFTADVVKAARHAGAKSMLLVNGWDNLTSKGTIPVLPDKIGVWGEQAKKDAMGVHLVPADRIVVLGAPQFESYFSINRDSRDGDEVRMMNAIPAGRRIILFAGCLVPFDETTVLRILDKAIDDGRLANCHILYRPHPWRHARVHEDLYRQDQFRHVSLDVQVKDVFLKTQETKNTAESKKHFPSLNYYPKLVSLAEFVISPLSTFVLESLLMGKQTLAICYYDGKHYFSADKMAEYEHVQILNGTPGLVFCKDPELLIENCQELLKPIDHDHLHQQLRHHLRGVVYSDATSYSRRLASVVETELASANLN